MSSPQYPDDLNPFGSDNEDEGGGDQIKKKDNSNDDYPDYLSPFGDDDDNNNAESLNVDDYDNSLNPFCDFEDEEEEEKALKKEERNETEIDSDGIESRQNITNDEDREIIEAIYSQLQLQEQPAQDNGTVQLDNYNQSPSLPPKLPSQQPNCDISQLMEEDQPPKPLPRTKRLLKKEQAQKATQQQEQQQYQTSVPINLGNT